MVAFPSSGAHRAWTGLKPLPRLSRGTPFGAIDAKMRPRQSFKSGFRNRHGAQIAHAVISGLESCESRFDLTERLPLSFELRCRQILRVALNRQSTFVVRHTLGDYVSQPESNRDDKCCRCSRSVFPN